MIQEIILALLGHPGQVVEDNGFSFALAVDYPSYLRDGSCSPPPVCDADRALVALIGAIAHNYTQLKVLFVEGDNVFRWLCCRHLILPSVQRFCDAADATIALGEGIESDVVPEQDQRKQQHLQLQQQRHAGMVCEALVSSLRRIMDGYHAVILNAQIRYHRIPTLPLSELYLQLRNYELLFPVLLRLVAAVDDNGCRGGALLSVIHRQSLSGVPVVRSALQWILQQCQSVLHEQLLAWVSHGIICDPHEEFFLSERNSLAMSTSRDTDESNNIEGGGGLVADATLTLAIEVSAESMVFDSWLRGVTLRSSMLPSYIPLSAAETLRFVGCAVRVLRRAVQHHRTAPSPSTCSSSSLSLSHSFLDGKKEDRVAPYPKLAPPLPSELRRKILAPLEELRQREWCEKVISSSDVESAVQASAQVLQCELRRVLVEDSQLKSHLRAFRDYFLMGRGDFFQVFVKDSLRMMSQMPNLQSEFELNRIFRFAAQKTSADRDAFVQEMRLLLPVDAQGSYIASVRMRDPWCAVSLSYVLQWPLGVLITEKVIQRFVSIFQFLLLLRRVSVQLSEVSSSLTRLRPKREREERSITNRWWGENDEHNGDGDNGVSKAARLRGKMAFVVEGLWSYIQVDAIGAEFQQLLSVLSHPQESPHYQHLTSALHQFLCAVENACFFRLQRVMQCLEDMLDLCLRFCSFCGGYGAHKKLMDKHKRERQINSMSREFKRTSQLFLALISAASTSHRTAHALSSTRSLYAPFAPLLLRIDYNRFFSHPPSSRLVRNDTQEGMGM